MTLASIESFLEAIEKASSNEDLLQIKSSLLGKNGALAQSLKTLGSLSLEERKKEGPRLNTLKEQILEALARKQKELEIEK